MDGTNITMLSGDNTKAFQHHIHTTSTEEQLQQLNMLLGLQPIKEEPVLIGIDTNSKEDEPLTKTHSISPHCTPILPLYTQDNSKHHQALQQNRGQDLHVVYQPSGIPPKPIKKTRGGTTEEQKRRRALRKIRNRESAEKSRRRKQQSVDNLKNQAQQLWCDNMQLRATLNQVYETLLQVASQDAPAAEHQNSSSAKKADYASVLLSHAYRSDDTLEAFHPGVSSCTPSDFVMQSFLP